MNNKKYNDTTIKHILTLIRWGANGYNELFKDEADEIAKELDSEGYHYQANFIKAQLDEIPTFEPMEIPNAEEVKDKSIKSGEKIKIVRNRNDLEYVLNSIKNASKDGNLWTFVDAYRLTDKITAKLRKAGYKVEFNQFVNMVGLPQAIIDWSGKDEA